MAALAVDVVASQFEMAERRLIEWGQECGRLAESVGVARSIGLKRIIEHVQREDRKRREEEKPRRECLDCGHVERKWGARVNGRWDRRACPLCQSTTSKEREPTAEGKESRSPEPLAIQQLSYRVMQVDAIVARLPGWMQQPIRRRYEWDQLERFAAFELRIDRELYRQRLKAGIMQVAEQLAPEKPPR